MKLRLFIIMFLLLLAGNTKVLGQKSFEEHPMYTYSIEQILDSLTLKGYKHGVDVGKLMDRFVNKIYVVPKLPDVKQKKILGKVVPIDGSLKSNIYIHQRALDDFFIAERVLAHELGHSFYLRHCCVGKYCIHIMAGEQTTNPESILYQIAFKFRYDETFDVYFDELKRKLNL